MKHKLLSLASILLFSIILNAQTTYYFVGNTANAAGAGSAGTGLVWTTASYWNTDTTTFTGTNRPVTPVPTDTLVIDGSVLLKRLTTKTIYLNMTKDSCASLVIKNGAIVYITSTSGTEQLATTGNITIGAAVGGVAYPVTGTGTTFTSSLKAGDYVSTTGATLSIGQVLSVFDDTRITCTNDFGFTGTALYRIPTLVIRGASPGGFTLDASSQLHMGFTSGTGSQIFYSIQLASGTTGNVYGSIYFQRNGCQSRIVAVTPGALIFQNGSSCIVQANPAAVSLGSGTAGPFFGTALGTGFAGGSTQFAFNSNAAGVVFASGSTYNVNAANRFYTPFGVAQAATTPLVYSGAVSFQPSSNFIHSSNYITANSYFLSRSDVSYGNLTIGNTYPPNFTAARVDNLTITTSGAATTNTGTINLYGNLANNTANAINFGNVTFAGSASQTVGGSGSGARSFNNVTINNISGVILNSAARVNGILTLKTGILATSGNLTLSSLSTGTAAIAAIDGVTNTGSITGNVTVERYIPSSGRKSYTMVSSAVSNPTIYAAWQEAGALTTGYGTQITGATTTDGFDAVSASGLPSVFTYNDGNTPGSKWVGLTNTNANTVSPGKGYLLYVRGDRTVMPGGSAVSNTTLRATGTVITGDFTPALATVDSSFNLVANPYPCAINWTTGITKSNLASSFYVYDPNLGVFITSDGTTKSPNVGQQQANVIQSGQAFFIQKSSGVPSITFTEAAKTTAATTTSTTTVFGNEAPASQLNINIYSKSNNELADGVVAIFGNSYKAGIAKEDAAKMDNFNETFSLTRNNNRLSIEGRPIVKGNDTLFFAMNNFSKKEYVLKIDGSNFSEANAALIDNYTGTQTAIDLAGISTYNFTVNGDVASTGNDRFMITFGSTATIAAGETTDKDNSLFVKVGPNPMSNQLQVNFKTATAENTIIKIINSLGQTVKTVHAGKVNAGNISIPTASLAGGLYTVQLISGDKKIASQKIVKE